MDILRKKTNSSAVDNYLLKESVMDLILGFCSICHNLIYTRNSYRRLEKCYHIFHKSCLLNHVVSYFHNSNVPPGKQYRKKFIKCPACNKRMNSKDRNWVENDGIDNVSDSSDGGYSTNSSIDEE